MGTLSISYNGTAITSESRTSYPTVSYNGSQIIGGFSGTKTLNTANKMMKGNLVIGGKTLNTKDKMMKGNVVATYTPSLGSRQTGTQYTDSYYMGSNMGWRYRSTNIANSYALFAIDKQNSGGPSIFAYNSSGTRSMPADTGYPIYSYNYYALASSIGNYAVVGHYWDTVEAYNTSLTKSTFALDSMDDMVGSGGCVSAATSSYAFFLAGYTLAAVNASLTVALNNKNASSLGRATRGPSAMSVNNTYMVVAGGDSSWNSMNFSSKVNTINNSLTKGTASDLPAAYAYGTGCSLGTGGFMVAGEVYNNGRVQVNNTFSFNSSLSRSNLTALSWTGYGLVVSASATSTNDYAFATETGNSSGGNKSAFVDYYATSGTKATAYMSMATQLFGMARAGNTLIIFRSNTSGSSSNSKYANVDFWSYS